MTSCLKLLDKFGPGHWPSLLQYDVAHLVYDSRHLFRFLSLP